MTFGWRRRLACSGAVFGLPLLLAAGCTTGNANSHQTLVTTNYVQVDDKNIVNLTGLKAISYHARGNNDADKAQWQYPYTITFFYLQSSDNYWIGYNDELEAEAAWTKISNALHVQ